MMRIILSIRGHIYKISMAPIPIYIWVFLWKSLGLPTLEKMAQTIMQASQWSIYPWKFFKSLLQDTMKRVSKCQTMAVPNTKFFLVCFVSQCGILIHIQSEVGPGDLKRINLCPIITFGTSTMCNYSSVFVWALTLVGLCLLFRLTSDLQTILIW